MTVFVCVDHYVVINLRQDGKVISTKETKGASGANAVWNAPFLFDLPAGDISRLPLLLEFSVMQVTIFMLNIQCVTSHAVSQNLTCLYH